MDNSNGSKDPSLYRQLMQLAAAGLQLTATIGGAAILGWFLDNHMGTKPWLLLTMIIVGSIGGFIQFVRTMRILSGGGPSEWRKP